MNPLRRARPPAFTELRATFLHRTTVHRIGVGACGVGWGCWSVVIHEQPKLPLGGFDVQAAAATATAAINSPRMTPATVNGEGCLRIGATFQGEGT